MKVRFSLKGQLLISTAICFIDGEDPSLQEILQFDPFGGEAEAPTDAPATPEAPSGEEKPAGVETAAEPGAPTAAGASAQAPAAAPTPAAEPPKPVSQADLESLIRQQTEAITQAVRPQPQAPAQPTQTSPKFNLGVPDALVSALRSEDPKEFSAGVGAMINGVANHVWNTVVEHLENQILPSIPQMIQRYAESTQRQDAVAKDFYGTYKELSIPELAPVVQAVGAQIAQEFAQAGKSLEWGPAIRDAIAERIFTRMPFLRQASQPQPQPQPNGKRPFITGAGARPQQPAAPVENEMLEMIFGGPRS